jgi:hypothetical protein
MTKVLEGRHAYIESILRDIKHILEEFSQKSLYRRKFHDAMQQRIVKLANKYNLEGLSEFRVNNIRADGRGGLIDVVWLRGFIPITIFEIDSSLRVKSINKLLAVEVLFRFWVYYGSRDSTFFIHTNDPNNLVHVIQLQGISFKRGRKI